MSVFKAVLSLAIDAQMAIPFMLPNEWIAWRRYGKSFSKSCDGCHDERGTYMLSMQDPNDPITVVYPFAFRLCLDCMCEADEKVGVFDKEDVQDEHPFFEIERT